MLAVTLSLLATSSSVAFERNLKPAAENVPHAIYQYVRRPEPAFAWQLAQHQKLEKGEVYHLEVTSQQWHDITWKHALTVCEPQKIRHPKHMLLFVTGGRNGGKPDEGDLRTGLALAELCQARIALLHQVPNQPLLGNRKEDDLITETWLRYLDTGDETWPLLFPMVKSAVKAMDALEEFAEQQWETKLEGFVITGASKRGWTSWLTPVVDNRVIGTAPIVIDVLNFRPQMKHQKETWGKYSDQIIDYSSKGLIVEGEENARERQLRLMMDPFTYRQQLELPKLLVNGTNDPYWVCDAMRLYWDDLHGPKYVLQVPNAGHGLQGGKELALSTVAAFFQHQASGTPLPQVKWSRQLDGETIQLNMSCSTKAVGARVWVAQSQTKDFRPAKWESRPLTLSGENYSAKISKPEQGHVAHFGELQFHINGVPYSLCTLIQRD